MPSGFGSGHHPVGDNNQMRKTRFPEKFGKGVM
jgi:hypothetical protein